MAKSQPQLRYPLIAARVFDTPLLVMQSKLITILQVLGPRMGFDVQGGLPKQGAWEDDGPADPGPQFSHLDGMLGMDVTFEPQDEGHFVGGGLAVIPIHGTLVQRGDWMSAWSGMLSYDRIERMVASAIDDKHVRELVYDMDTPGGEVAGVFDLSDRMVEMRDHGGKKITAVSSELAASAGYLLASTAHQIIVPRTGAVGSVGVVGAHYDYSRMMDKRGVAVTFIYAGEKKVDGNPYAPLPASVKAEWQAEINETYKLFVDTVARNMGLSPKKVRDTEAAVFIGSKAVDAGLAHRVNSFSNEVGNAVLRQGGSYRLQQTGKENEMSDKAKAEAEAKAKADAEAEAKAKAEAEAKVKAEAEAKVKAEAEAKAKAEAEAKANDPKARIKAITKCDEAKGREEMAEHLAYDTDMSVEQAKALLAKAPKKGGLSDAMARAGTPGISSAPGDAGNSGTGKEATIDTGGIYAGRKAVFDRYAAGQVRPTLDK